MKPLLVEPPQSPYRVPFDGSFRIASAPTAPPKGAPGKKDNKGELERATEQLAELQRVLYADSRFAVLLVFQAMDAAGKDGTIRAVLSGINPAGCHAVSFKQPTSHERQQNFLWRISRELPRRGKLGIFNRSHYEEVLIVRVHPEHLAAQNLPDLVAGDSLWEARLESIVDFERHLARNGTLVLKFFLNVSRDEQKQRFLSRARNPDKHWKFSAADIEERRHWDDYMRVYEEALNATSRPWAPWFSIPADDKPYMRTQVARIVCDAVAQLPLEYPDASDEDEQRMQEAVRKLEKEED